MSKSLNLDREDLKSQNFRRLAKINFLTNNSA